MPMPMQLTSDMQYTLESCVAEAESGAYAMGELHTVAVMLLAELRSLSCAREPSAPALGACVEQFEQVTVALRDYCLGADGLASSLSLLQRNVR